VQTTLLGLAITFIVALIAALVGPYFIDWNQFRPQFEAEAARIVGAPVRVGGELDARLLPTPSLRLRSVVVGGANDLGKVRADKLDMEFSLGSLMRGEWRADELTITGMSLDLGLDSRGRIDWPVSSGKFNLGSLAIDRLNLTGRIALHDAASHGTVELSDIAFGGDVRSLAGAVRGDGSFTISGTRYPFRVSSGQSADGNGTRVHLNVDPGARPLSLDLDGVLSFEARAPRFEGAIVLATPAGLKAPGNVPITPWRIAAKLKADAAAARLEQVEASYGPEERALKLAGQADVRFGASPLLHAALSARQLDADRLAAKDSGATEPVRLLPAWRALIAELPQPPIPTQIEFTAEQIMFGGRPIQNIAADLRNDAKSWTIERVDLRAPGNTLVSLSGAKAHPTSSNFTAALSLESSDPDTLLTWWQGRGDLSYRSQKLLSLQGNVSVGPGKIAIDALQAELDGGAVEGRVELTDRQTGGSRLDAELKGERLDLDAAMAFARSIAGPQAEWPDEARVSLNIGRAISSGQELRPFTTALSYTPKNVTLTQLRIGTAAGVTLEGAGDFDRINGTGKLSLNSSAASLGQITDIIAPFAPTLASRLSPIKSISGPARVNLALDVGKNPRRADRTTTRAVLKVEASQLNGEATLTATPEIAALRQIDLDALRHSEFGLESKLSSDSGRTLLALLGLDHAIGMSERPAQFAGSVTGAWGAPLRLKAKLSAVDMQAEAQGTAEPWAQDTKANFDLSIRGVSLGPLLDLRPTDTLAQNINLSTRVSLSKRKLTFDDLDTAVAGSRLRGRLAVSLDGEKNVEGEIGLDTLDLAPAFALAIGGGGHDATEPLGAGLLKGWRGRVAFQALRGVLPGGSELRPVSGAIKSSGQSLSFDTIKGGIGGGELVTDVDARPGANGIVLNARAQLSGVDGSALRYRNLILPAGRTSMQMTLMTQGRSAAALAGALSGSGTVTIQSARIPGLDPRVFDVAIRASDNGQATDDARLRQIIEPVLSAGALSIKSAQIPFTVGDGRLRVGATTLEADGARATISGGYDIPGEQADIRVSLASTDAGQSASRPEIQLFAVGSPDGLHRTIDVASLSSWLAVRAIDRETRRLDSLDHGERAPSLRPASIPSVAATPSSVATPDSMPPDAPTSELPPTPRRIPLRPRSTARPTPAAPAYAAPVISQQLAPLPPPIEVRPVPGGIGRPPKPRPPLVLTPPAPLLPR
jgi:large subunit ribosomal protein L24